MILRASCAYNTLCVYVCVVCKKFGMLLSSITCVMCMETIIRLMYS